MDAADLDYRVRTLSGCIPPDLVSRLVELGHGAEVEFQAGRGEWFCAREQARQLAERGRREEALEVLAPYVATGWRTATTTVAGLLEEWGRAEEAIALARPGAEAGDTVALDFHARLLARHGRGDEAFVMLRPHVESFFLAAALVDVAEVTGRDEEAAALLAARIEAGRGDGPSCRRGVEPFNAVGLLAAIRERQGRVDEAVALLRTREETSVDNRDQLADLLARHDRIAELREYAAADPRWHAAQRLAELLEEHGDVEGAVAVYRWPRGPEFCRCHGTLLLAELLARHGRFEEATEAMRALADSPGGAEDWIVDTLCTLYADQGRPEEALAYLDTLEARLGEEEWSFFRMRLSLMAACGRSEEAVELARAHPESGAWWAVRSVARLLAGAGRTGEAIALLERHPDADGGLRARYLLDLGRVGDAVALLQRRGPEPPERETSQAGTPFDEPPF
ncbi:hypothetical protein [Streptosporangium sp. NPDC048865]|uniref:tetratricopeptide repeat protein n=1 Tax=Streptosporangium sp. NPDC048865 TaxID=3155766 RepID=UPI00343156B4